MSYVDDKAERLASVEANLNRVLSLCRALLMNDSRWPWLILVPRRDGAVELTDLGAADRAALIEEAAVAADWLRRETGADMINLGALAKVVQRVPGVTLPSCDRRRRV